MFLTVLILILCLMSAMSVRRVELLPFGKSEVLPLRGLLVLLVVVGHSLAIVDLGKYGLEFQAVAVFFFLSGYGLMKKRMRADGKPLRGGFQHAVVKLSPAFLIASAGYMLYVSQVGGGVVSLAHNIIKGSSNLPIPFTWYVPAIFALYGIFYLSDRFCRDNWKLLCCATLGVIGYWVLTALVLGWPFYWWKAVGGFVTGLVFAMNEERLRKVLAKSTWKVFSIAAIVLLGVYGLDCITYFQLRFAADHLFFAILGPIVALAMYRIRIPRFFGFLGVISYEMYIVHGAFVESQLRNISSVSALLYVCVVVLCSAVAGVVLHWGVKILGLKA